MLTFNFKRIFRARGIDKPFSYLVKGGYSQNMTTRIVNGRVKPLDLTDIERLCVLFQCTPNDFLEWKPGSHDVNPGNHPLAPLKRDDTMAHLTQLINTMPLEKLQAIENVIKQELGK